MLKYLYLLLFGTLCIIACNHKGDGTTTHKAEFNVDSAVKADSSNSTTSYLKELENWRASRLENLKRPRSWTTLVGLTWLKAGANTFGSAKTSDIRLSDSAPENVGTWTVTVDSIYFKVAQEVEVRLSDQSVFLEGPVISDGDGTADLFHLGPLYWTVIKRSELYGIRVWDTTHQARTTLTEIPSYKIDPDWRLQATELPALEGATITMDNAVGQSITYPIAGHVVSSKDGIDINLIALDGGPNDLFLIFNDLTTDIETYSGGRYLYIPRGDSLGKTVLDFNKAYNPPCVFTTFATCLLPPKPNFIDSKVVAGEKDYGEHNY